MRSQDQDQPLIPCSAWSREQSQRISGVDSISVSLYFEDQELCSFEEDCISDSQAGAMLNHTICMCLDPDSFRASCTARLSALHVLCLPHLWPPWHTLLTVHALFTLAGDIRCDAQRWPASFLCCLHIPPSLSCIYVQAFAVDV